MALRLPLPRSLPIRSHSLEPTMSRRSLQTTISCTFNRKVRGFETLRIISILTYSQAPIYQCFHLTFLRI